MKKIALFALLLSIAFLSACDDGEEEQEVICTEEFVVIGVTITGGELSDYYTLRAENSDTIRFSEDPSFPIGHWYPIIDDDYQGVLEDKQEEFIFVGTVNDVVVVNQSYWIGADKCHVYKESGPSTISL